MSFGIRRKPRERYYLLPGMGGRAARKKLALMIGWGLLGGLATSLIVAAALYVINRLATP